MRTRFKRNRVVFSIVMIALFACCTNGFDSKSGADRTQRDTVYIHDTVSAMPNGDFFYNLPCKVVNIHQEKEGKSLLFIWLHGGVYIQRMHDMLEPNSSLLACYAVDSVLNYLQEKGLKSVALFPICHKAKYNQCVPWIACYYDVMKMIEDLVRKDIVDTKRIFLAGSSDGGVGTWDFLQKNEQTFAAAMPMSCGNPRKTTIPVYFFNTQAEQDCSLQVDDLNRQGSNIEYKHSSAKWHGRDDIECTHEFLDRFFGNSRK